ncbi:uncharacterized protein BJ171DRAFT_496971 [Polychytrium aggregatum]|uniref:uncharacterized protein n=1 Tax=Polychytrium aggregatum TaxID=110093 RepID=UPI0022FDEC62|nr:uncharacterized protein BJ171DRAFT_496971 [Polychytrium aggregatum]KAI9206791.1 hypothetical protein BJ171DRAFT_496971 [Polychytrium aggregatum]
MLHNNDGTGGSTSNLTGRQKVSSIYGSVYQPNGGTSPAANSVSSYSSLVAESKKKIPKEQKPSKDSRARRPSSPASSSLSPKNSIGSSDLGAPSPFISRQSSIKGFRKHPQSASQDFPAAPRFSKLADERSRSAIAKTHSVGSGDLINPVESNTSSSSLMAPKQYYTTTNASGSQILDSSLRQFAPYKSASSRDYASSESIPTKSMRTVASTTRSQQYKSENDPRRSSRSKHRTERSQDDDLASSRSPTTEDINSLRMQIQGLQSQLDSKKKEASTRSSTSSYDGSAAEKPKKTKWGLIHKIRKLFMKSKSKKESSSGSSYATDSAPASAPASAPVLVRGSDRM